MGVVDVKFGFDAEIDCIEIANGHGDVFEISVEQMIRGLEHYNPDNHEALAASLRRIITAFCK